MPNEKRAVRSRLDFSKIPTATQIPNLIEVQRRSYERFLQMDKLPNERDDASGFRWLTGNFSRSSVRRISCPTAPVAPTTAMQYEFMSQLVCDKIDK